MKQTMLLFGSVVMVSLTGCGAGVEEDVEQGLETDAAEATDATEGTGTVEAALASDSDGDGISNLREVCWGTNPYRPDTDLDGMSDAFEALLGSSPTLRDSDGDGISDLTEYYRGTLSKHWPSINRWRYCTRYPA